MKREYTNQEIRWIPKSIYVDLDTGENINEETAKAHYIIIKTKKHTHVYRQTGTITYTRECRRDIQGKLF